MSSAWSYIRSCLPCLASLLLLATSGCASTKQGFNSCWQGCKATFQNCGASCPRIDPTGQALLVTAPPKPKLLPAKMSYYHDTAVQVSPARVIAPVGTEVVVLAGVCGQKNTLKPGEKVEWMMAPGGVGHFVDIGGGIHQQFYKLVGAGPKKIDNTLVVGKTVSKLISLTRGTPEPGDDVTVQPGQAWVTVTSPIEGTSHVTAFAPDVYGWDTRKQTSLIYWVDAQWVFPPPAINPAGTSHKFTTVVTRQTDNAPQVGWSVRYEILDGPEAGFAPDGAKVVEVPTNDLGQGIVEMFQPQPAAGTNNISVQVIRPAELGSGRLVLGTGTTHKTWTAGDIGLRVTAPQQVAVGSMIQYRVDVTNPGDLSLRGVIMSNQLQQGLTFIDSNRPATAQNGRIEWSLGDISARTTQSVIFNVRADRANTYNTCVSVRSAENLNAQDCAATTVLPGGAAAPATITPTTGQLDVQVTGPPQAAVGETVRFDILVTNRGNGPATGLVMIDRFDPGLQHAVATSPIERDFEDLPPGASRRVSVDFRVISPGQLCNDVEVRTAGGLSGRNRACVTAVASGGAAPAAIQPASITVRKVGPTVKTVGETAEFKITVTNNGTGTLTQVKVSDTYDRTLDPVTLTDNFRFVGDSIEWTMPELPPGKSVVFEINCKCIGIVPRACNRVTVTSPEGARGESEACLEIRPASAAGAPAAGTSPNTATAGSLQLTITELQDPIAVGKEVTYDVRVTNNGTTPDQQVAVALTAPPEMTPLSAGSGGATAFRIEGQTINFAPFPEIRAGQTIHFQIRMRANQAGTARVQAQLQSRGASRPVSAVETTTIIGPN